MNLPRFFFLFAFATAGLLAQVQAATAPSVLAIVPIPAPAGQAATIYAHVSDPDGNIDWVRFYYWNGSGWAWINDAVPSSGATDAWVSVSWTPPSASTSYNIHVGTHDTTGLTHDQAGTWLQTPLTPIGTDSIVGTLPGDLSVDNKGSANYSIPLSIPPGRGGLQPSLSLSYSSGGGNGTVGVGWSLSTGFPQGITRGRSILARDNKVRGITFDDTNSDATLRDKFYLDGKRLICISGTQGAAGSQYRTEVDSFVSIVTSGSGSIIDTFTVVDKSGTKMIFGKYGSTTDGFQAWGNESQGLAYTYALKRVEDLLGNYVEFTYTSVGNGEHVLASVAYTGGPSVNPYVRVNLGYNTQSVAGASARKDVNRSSLGFRYFDSTKRLDEITAVLTSNNEPVTKYYLAYDYAPNSGRTRLASITPQFRDSASGQFRTVPATTLQWSNETVTTANIQAQPVPSTPNGTYRMQQYSFGDFNGDGKTDYLSADNTYTVYLSTASGFSSGVSWFSGSDPYERTVIKGDFNGDGKDDLIYGDGGFMHLYALKSTGSGFAWLTGSSAWVIDTTNIFKDPVTGITTQEMRGKERSAMASRITPSDLNGDGRDDLLMHDFDGYIWTSFSTGTGFTTPVKSAQKGNGWVGAYASFDWVGHFTGNVYPPSNYAIQPMPCELNGDGIMDYASVVTIRGPQENYYTVARVLELRVSNGTGDFTSAPVTLDAQTAGTTNGGQLHWLDVIYGVLPGDVNGDGLTDFLVLGNGKIDGVGTGGPILPQDRRRWVLYLNRGCSASGYPYFDTVPGAIPNTVNSGAVNSFYQSFTGLYDSWLLTPYQHYNDSTYAPLFSTVESSGGSGMSLTDMNADGFADLVWYGQARTFAYTSGGPAVMEEVGANTKGWWVIYSTGGKADGNGHFFANATRLTVNNRNPQSLWETSSLTPTPGSSSTVVYGHDLAPAGDFNGDGRVDWTRQYSFNGQKENFNGIALGQGGQGDLVTAVTNGLGSTTSVAYLAAKNDVIYTSGAAVSYPIREVRPNTFIVSDVFKDSGGSATAQFSYQYSGNRLDLAGRGPLGFHSFVTLDRQTNLFKYQFLAQSFPMTGLTHREQTYRHWSSSGNAYFRTISSHDNTIVFDEVVSGGGTPYGTVYPFMSTAVESRWEDSTTAHYPVSGTWSLSGSPSSKAELLFTSYKTNPPASPHITITAQSWFDNQSLASAPLSTVPAPFQPSDTTSGGANAVVGVTYFPTYLSPTYLPRQITYGNLRQLRTDFGGGFTEKVVTTYVTPPSISVSGVSVPVLQGRVDKIVTSVVAPGYGTEANPEYAPDKYFTYATVGGVPTALPLTENVDADRNGNVTGVLDLKTTYAYDSRGRVTSTTVTGSGTPAAGSIVGSLTDANAQYIGEIITETRANYFDTFDLPREVRNAYSHLSNTTAFHPYFGKPTSVTGPNSDTVTTDYDALGRPTKVTDVLKQLAQRMEFGLTPTVTSTSDWKSRQTVTPPSGHTGVASGAPITGVSGVSLTSVYAVRSYETTASGTSSYKSEVWTYYDRLGRAIRVIKEGFNGQRSVTDTAYNNLGQTIAVSLPYKQETTPTILWTKSAYDALGRVATVTAPNGTLTTNEYFGRATRVTVDAPLLSGVNPAPQSNVTLVDFKGRTVKVWNADNLPTLTGPVTDITTPTASIQYNLDGFGRMRATVLKNQSQQITATYDAHGRQLSLNDPDKGNWTYLNNALGHVVRQTDAKSTVTRTTFDRLGRQLTRTTTETAGPVETADWYYWDLATNAAAHQVAASGNRGWVGAAQRDTVSTASVPGYTGQPTTNVTYYNDRGLPLIGLSQIDGKWFYTYTDYDTTYWRVTQVRHYWRPPVLEGGNTQPYVWQEFGYTYGYDGKSYLTSLVDTAGRTWWQADASAGYDHLDRPVKVRKGAGHWTQRTYRAEDGVLTAIATGPTLGSTSVQNLSFGFDGLGNLVSRGDGSLSESFVYDNLNRLTTSTVGGQSARSTVYFANGNISSKQDVTGASSGTYTYDANKPHAVASAWGYSMTYDANGNLLTRSKTTGTTVESWDLRYAGFDKPRWMAKQTTVNSTLVKTVGSEFLYNANRSRVLHLEFDQLTSNVPSHYVRKKIYAYGATMEVDYDNTAGVGVAAAWSMKTVRVYVPGPDGTIGTMELAPNMQFNHAEKKRVYHYDHLGSIERITDWGDTSTNLATDESGKPSRFSSDPWGERRDPLTWSGKPQITDDGGSDSASPRGFTGHEMLDDLGLVHMNGRIYDPLIGRFLSADTIVDGKYSLQGYNRYSYVHNNPLSYKDESGHWLGLLVDAFFIVKDTAEFITGKQSGTEYAANMALNAGSVALNIFTGGGGTGMQLAARGSVAAVKVVAKEVVEAEVKQAVQTVVRQEVGHVVNETMAQMQAAGGGGGGSGGDSDSGSSDKSSGDGGTPHEQRIESPQTHGDDAINSAQNGNWDDALFKTPDGYPGSGMSGTNMDHAIPQALAERYQSLENLISGSGNLREMGAAMNQVDKAPLDKDLVQRFSSLVDDLIAHEGLSEAKAVEKAFQSMSEEIASHANRVPDRAMDPAEIARLRELQQ